MPDYQNGLIYLIYVGEQKYVGSTCNFESRKSQHKHSLDNPNNKGSNRKVYKAIRENGNEWHMELYKQFPCNSEKELHLEEERIRKELGAELNERCCGTGIETQDNEQYQKQYREQNKDKFVNYIKQYQEKNREKLRERDKHYYQKTREKVREQQKQYQEKNREKIREQQAQKIECPICGSVVSRNSISRHQQTAKCKRIAEQRAEEVGSC